MFSPIRKSTSIFGSGMISIAITITIISSTAISGLLLIALIKVVSIAIHCR
ncbi:Uncharacterised protein [Mycobacterium tuberculosis]|nr:Uncharacterised protein [Mycobacterium tuberculosis]